MAYATSNPPRLVSESPLTGANQQWSYSSSDAAATVDTAGYITNALDLGMKAADLVDVFDTVNSLVTKHRVFTVTSTGADLGTGTTIGSSANTD